MSTGGLCGSDIHMYEDGRIDRMVIDKPITLGHEISGTVSKLGSGVTTLAVGDRVAIDPIRPCGRCNLCKKKRTNICPYMNLSGLIVNDGGFANYMTTPAYTCHKLPDNISLDEGAMIEPVSIGVHAIKRAKLEKGELVIVIGAGPIGLLVMQIVKAYGAGKVLITDINEKRLELASKLGADVVHKPKAPITDPKAVAEELKAALGDEADLCVECSAAKGIVDVAIHTCRIGGRVMMVGLGEMAMHTHIGMAAAREIDILGSFTNATDFPDSIQLVASGKVNVKSAITHKLPLDKALQAFELCKTGQSMKVVLDCTT